MLENLLGKLRKRFRRITPKRRKNKMLSKYEAFYGEYSKQKAYHSVVFQLPSGYELHILITVKPKEGQQLSEYVKNYVADWKHINRTSCIQNREIAILYCIAQEFTEGNYESISIDNIEVSNIVMEMFFNIKPEISKIRVFSYDFWSGMEANHDVSKLKKTKVERAIEPHINELVRLYGELCATL